jgi:pimeloyl-ACP methyl ester carboxylesterase
VELFLAVECHESAPFNGPEALERARGSYPDVLEHVGLTTPYYLASCDAWHAHRAAPAQAEPVQSDVPALIVAGEFDPVTPRRYGALAAAGLPRASLCDRTSLSRSQIR